MKSQLPFHVPIILNGISIQTGVVTPQLIPTDHKIVLAQCQQGNADLVKKAIHGALAAKPAWEALPFNDRAAIFLKAADLLAKRWRYKVMAATMLGRKKVMEFSPSQNH